MNEIFNLPDYNIDIATESISLTSIKQTVSKIITTIKEAIQRLINWVSSKFAKFVNMETVTIDQKLYNEIITTIKSILTVDTRSIERVLMDINTFMSNEDNVKKYGDIICKKLEDLTDYAENIKKIEPCKNGKTLTFSASKLKSFKSNLHDMQSSAYQKMVVINRIASDQTDLENLKYTHTQIVLIGRLAAIDMKKSSVCIELMDKLMKHCKVNDKNKKGDDTVVNDDYNSENTNDTHGIAGESDISIAQERYSDARKIYASNLKTLDDKIRHVEALPESTIDEINAKLAVYSELIDISYKACQELRKVRPGNLDKFISGIAYVVSGTLDIIADTSIRSSSHNLGPQSPNVSENYKNIVKMAGVKWIARLVGKGMMGNRQSKVDEILDRMILKNKSYNEAFNMLKAKKQRILEKQKESLASEAFILFCDNMMIAEENMIKKFITRNVVKMEKFSKDLEENKSSFTSSVTIGDREVPIKYNGYKGSAEEGKCVKKAIELILSKHTHHLIAVAVIRSNYKPEDVKKIKDKINVFKSIYVKELKISGSGSKIKIDIIIQDLNQNKTFNLNSLGETIKDITKGNRNNVMMNSLLLGQQLNLQNQQMMQMINQQNLIQQQQLQQQIAQQNMIQQQATQAMNFTINSGLNASAMSIGMPAGSFGMF